MQLWQDLVRIALIGVERQNTPLPLESAGPELKALLAQLEAAAPETALLQAAGLLTLWRRAGYGPGQVEGGLGQPAPAESLSPCSPEATAYLTRLLNGHFPDLLPEWLETVAAQGQLVPPEHLPDLLEMGRQKLTLRKLITAVAGARGEWLAAQNPDWFYATRPDPQQVWETGAASERLAVLRRLREETPNLALSLLAGSWASEPPENRASFIQALGIRLNPADEPFLEAALDDRRKEVRKSAAELLSRLPESHLCRRMSERLEPLLAFKKGLLGGGSLAVRLPEAYDSGLGRDGVEEKTNSTEFGPRAWWLCQMLAAVPPGFWSRRWQQSPRNLIAAARKSEEAAALLLGWAIATRRHQAFDWLEALVIYSLEQNNHLKLLNEASLFTIFPSLPPERLEALLLESFKFETRALYDQHPLFLLLHMATHSWSANTARAVVGSLQERIESGSSPREPDWQLRASLKEFACHVPANLYPELAQDWPQHAPSWERWADEVDEFLSVLQFRYEMRRTIEGT